MTDGGNPARLGMTALLLRRLDKAVDETGRSFLLWKYRHIGATDISRKAVIEPGARIELSRKSPHPIVLRIGSGSRLKGGCLLAPRDGFIHMGQGCSINPYCVLLGYGGITLGNNVRMAHSSSIVAFNHVFDELDVPIALQGNRSKGVVIEDDVWIGAGVRILDGVHVGKGAVIGAGSVVTKDVPAGAVMVGMAARPLRMRDGSPRPESKIA